MVLFSNIQLSNYLLKEKCTFCQKLNLLIKLNLFCCILSGFIKPDYFATLKSVRPIYLKIPHPLITPLMSSQWHE